MSIITSLLDTDLYKLTMMQCVYHQFPKANVQYQFACRHVVSLSHLIPSLQAEIKALCALRFTQEELEYLKGLPYFKSDFIEYLEGFSLDAKAITLAEGESLSLTIQGYWAEVILFEVPLLAIINELYFQKAHPVADEATGWARLQSKVAAISSKPSYDAFRFCDFGTRRRFSKAWQESIVVYLKEHLREQFAGTSNVHLARIHQLLPRGTMAHEFFQGCQVLAPDLKTFQAFALGTWLREYPDYLKVALTDVIQTDSFLKDFDESFAKAYVGLRHDSGDPVLWTEKILKHYQQLNINPKEKTLVYSDALTVKSALALFEAFHSKVNMLFGIGTHLTNDLGYEPLQIIIKLVSLNHQPVAKISDSPTKGICLDNAFLNNLKTLFAISSYK